MFADFVGDRLFTDNGSGLEALVSSIDVKDRPAFIQYILDFISYLKKKFVDDKNISLELSRLEDSFNRMISEAQQIRQTDKTNQLKDAAAVTYDNNGEVVPLSQKLRDTAHRVNDVERPKPNEGYALKNDISNNSISKYDNEVNQKFSMPSEAGILFREYENGKISKEEYSNRMEELWDKTISEIEDEALAQRIADIRYFNQESKRHKKRISLRHLFYQETKERYKAEGRMTNAQIERELSESMGHSRNDVNNTYSNEVKRIR